MSTARIRLRLRRCTGLYLSTMRLVTQSYATFMTMLPSLALYDLARFGAVRLTDCPNADALSAIGAHLDLSSFSYIGGAAPRKKVARALFTANEAPGNATIPLHHELGHAKHRPSHIAFFCERGWLGARSGWYGATLTW